MIPGISIQRGTVLCRTGAEVNIARVPLDYNCYIRNLLVSQLPSSSLYYCHGLIFYIYVILYLRAGGYKCRLTTFPTRFAHGVSIL